jgi:hypothetical protein
MKKSVVLMAFICLIVSAKSQTVANSPSQAYAVGYSTGKSIYDLQHTSPMTSTIQDEIVLRQDKYNNTYEYIIESYHSSTTAGALTAGYLNGLANTGVKTISGSSYPSPPPTGGSLDGLINYDASILFPLGTAPTTFSTTVSSNVASGGTSGRLTLTFYQVGGNILEIVFYFE